jgi:solute carrier family 35 protein
MRALAVINIPMFLALRRTLIFFVFIASLLIGKNNKNDLNLSFGAAIVLITSGAIVAGRKKH